jgi:DNA invertase Pin-like site-specific DNA recombinase
MRVAIYARFSSDLQDARSIADQIGAARDHAARQGWQVVSEFCDAAISGSSLHNRPGLLDLLVAAQQRQFDAVLTESIDRLSRDLEDIAGLHKRMAYWGVKIITLADGEVGKLHVGLKGIIASIYLDDLAQKTRRGQVGRVKAGRIPGGKCYGYDVVREGDDRGRRTINEAEAEIVRRIFKEYVGGESPIGIATRLNAERIPSPRGGQWNASTINGSRLRLNGIINNRLYGGRLVYNRQRFIKDPATGKRQARRNPPDQWLEQAIPELAIVPDELFEAAQARRALLGGPRSNGADLGRRRRPKHLLSGLLRCASCGASMIIICGDRVGCSAHQNKGTCDNRRSIRLAEIEERVVAALKSYLLAPDLVAEAVEAYRIERSRLAKERAKQRRNAERDLAAIDRKIAGVVAGLESGGDPRALAQRLNDLEAERRALLPQIPSAKESDAIAVHPNAAERYRQKVADVHAALTKGDEASREAITLVRELIERITVEPTPPDEPPKLELFGNLAALMHEPRENMDSVPMVAGARFGRDRHIVAAPI